MIILHLDRYLVIFCYTLITIVVGRALECIKDSHNLFLLFFNINKTLYILIFDTICNIFIIYIDHVGICYLIFFKIEKQITPSLA